MGVSDMKDDQDWRDQAACAGMDTELFFHTVGASSHVKDALRICNGGADREPCPVRFQCGEFALSFANEEDIAGVFGGMIPAERKRIRKQRVEEAKEKANNEKALAEDDVFTRQLRLLLALVHDVVTYDVNGKPRHA